jgi:phage baseplate assembly protein W
MAAINIKFPLQDDNAKNGLFLLNEVTKDALTSNLLLLLLTKKGERYYQPDYGTNLLQYIFEPKDNFTLGDIQEEIRFTVKTFIPQLDINNIQFYSDIDDQGNKLPENQVDVVIDFTFSEETFSEQGTLRITL